MAAFVFGASNEMEWLNLHASMLDSEQFIGAEPVDRATWLCLLRYCAGQENAGIIRDCQQWGDRKWQQLARVTLLEVRRESALWEWQQNDLRVWAYPVDKEMEVQRLRRQSKEAADVRWNGKNGHKKAKKPRRQKPNPYIDTVKHKDAHSEPLIPEKSRRLDPDSKAFRDT
jgi:hypothetical protein